MMAPGGIVDRGRQYLNQFNRNLWILSAGWFVSAIGFAVSIPFIAIYFHSSLHLNMAQIGLFFGTLAMIRSFFQALGGELADRLQRRWLLIYTQIMRAIGFAVLAAAVHFNGGFWAVALSLVLTAILGAIFQPVANAMVADILPQQQRLDGYAITRSALNLGWAAGPALGGFLATYSYGALFLLSGVITLASGLIILFWMRTPPNTTAVERFRFNELLAIRQDSHLLRHAVLVFCIYVVVAQLIAPLSVYAVEIVGLAEYQLGLLYTLNGLLVVILQVPVTRLLARCRLTFQLAMGSLLYCIGYSLIGACKQLGELALAIVVVTLGEVIMSPPALALTSRLAPEGRIGRYMGIFGFSLAAGWSLGPLFGGLMLQFWRPHYGLAWISIASLALIAAIGYVWFSRGLPAHLDRS
jgi:MFS family permease